MRLFASLLTITFAALPALHAEPGDPTQEHQVLVVEGPDQTVSYSWLGKANRTYFIQHSSDLVNWDYIPLIESGFGERIEWKFGTLQRPFFLRVYYTDLPASNPDTADFDSDGVDNLTELTYGTNPFALDDHDTDGIPNAYDRDLWPASEHPALNALLGNVLINEVLMANNYTNTYNDQNYQPVAGDWIELYNPTNVEVNLSGWHLSDSATNLTKYTFPPGTKLQSEKFLVVWASSVAALTPGGIGDLNNNGILDSGEVPKPYHANYKLEAGDYRVTPPVNPDPVILSRPQAGMIVIVDSFIPGTTPNFGPQKSDVSFGRYPSSTGLKTGYLPKPTPGQEVAVGAGTLGPVGAHNVIGGKGFTEPPTFATTSSAPGLYEAPATVTATILPPAHGVAIRYTTDSSDPTAQSALYTGPITASRTKIIRAVAVREGYLPSPSITRSYLFKEDILGTSPQGTTPTDHQGARNAQGQFSGILQGYPEETEGGTGYELLYHLDTSTIAAKKNLLWQELSSVPVVSIVLPKEAFFDYQAGGIYPNSGQNDPFIGSEDPLGTAWQRAASFEFIEANKSSFHQANAGLEISGASSTSQYVTRKHNLRVKFTDYYGPETFIYEHGVFSDLIGIPEFSNFILKNPTHDSWSNTWGNGGYLPVWGGYTINDAATYTAEAWAKAAHQAMGHDTPRFRWVQLFINGIYWGPYQLNERVDGEFMNSHFGDANYDVIKQGDEAVSGNTTQWNLLLSRCTDVANAATADKAAKYALVTDVLDVENYVDYLLVNLYMQNSDWPANNSRAARRKPSGNKWKFFIWDAEMAFKPGHETETSQLVSSFAQGGVMVIHQRLATHQAYRDTFNARVHRHFFHDPNEPQSGSLAIISGQDQAVLRFEQEMARIETILTCESARWGYMMKPIPYAKSDATYNPNNLSNHPLGDWDRATTYIRQTWLPNRRVTFLNYLQSQGLYTP